MDLVFTKRDNYYVAEFKAESDFSLHIEREVGGKLEVYQRSSDTGEYAIVEQTRKMNFPLVSDTDFIMAVPPKYIMVKSETAPKVSQVTFA